MKVWTVALACALLPAVPASAQDASDAYVNEEAREMVRLARLHRATVDRRIERYQTTARERFSVALSAGMIDKLMYRRETATRIDWRRDGTVRLDVLGMREFSPLDKTGPTVPADISAELLSLAFDPSNADILIRIDTTEISHPLNNGSEKHYRFEAGDSTVIQLPDGRTVRLRELRVMPRVRSPVLFSGSLWLEATSHAIVQAYIRLGRAIDADTDVSISTDSTEGFSFLAFTIKQLMGLMKPLRFDIDFIAIDYGLWDLEWWLPRVAVARGVAQIGRFRVPISYERTYSEYTVEGDVAAALAPRADTAGVLCWPRVRYVLPHDSLAVDTVRQARTDSHMARRDSARGDNAPTVRCPREFILTALADSVLLTSAELPTSLYADEFELIGEEDLDGIMRRVRALQNPPWRVAKPVLQWGLSGPGLFRYNRVEGASFGVRLLFPAGFATLRPEVRFGLADRQLRGELSMERTGDAVDVQVAGYRRLRSASMASQAHGTGASLGALLFGRDDEEYFDARGAELILRPHITRTQWFTAQVYAERQSAVQRNTHFSVARLLGADREFDNNMIADAADQLGARFSVRGGLGRLPQTARVEAELSLGGETGDFTFIRPELLLRAETLLPGRFSAALEGAAGTIEGDSVPVQALWRLDGNTMLRGYPRGSTVGERYWRTRAELGYDMKWFHVFLFSDIAWAGPRTRFDSDGVRTAYGVGLSQFGGLVRIDLARGLTAPGGWRLHARINTRF